MRTRNRSLLLDRAIRDVLAQSFSDWLLVLVNDGGQRSEVDPVVEKYRPQLGDRLLLLHHEIGRGMEAASNAGIRASASQYIAVHDDDDQWHPEFLTRTVNHLETTTDAGAAVRTEIVYERIDGGDIVEVSREIFCPDIRAITLFDTLRHNRCVPISLLHRRSLHETVGYFDEDLDVVGDWEFQLRVLQAHTIGFIDGEPLAFWHQRRESSGDLGNSVIVSDTAHHDFDRNVRDKHLRNYVSEAGLGALLYLSKYQDQEANHFHDRQNYSEGLLRELVDRSGRTEERLRLLEESISDASFVSLVRRRYRRMKDRLTRG
ncbi:glycosyltransferase family 2 protein [Arthrobacter sp. zg-ZUI100]|uniref:glycosyltransferase family 2 protein n=1 Tax=Arthrobacter jiangjiafuii TaxID=2817475 RepID=UPI001AEEEA0F|nr:glycosyltransferase family 2 protein [Arthrobacter jiangjiafuii]MBP3036083.1 glycosyltransferase family 2 protein [Arthrobacter jiangjiafuii]